MKVVPVNHSMTKLGLFNRLEQIRLDTENDVELQEVAALRVIDALLDYVNNSEIREKVEEIAL